jgi:hypothetical protein
VQPIGLGSEPKSAIVGEMHIRTLGALFGSVGGIGAGALTQSPQYSYLALPIAIASGIVLLGAVLAFSFSNRQSIRSWIRRLEPSYITLIALLVAAIAMAWQMYRGPVSRQTDLNNISSFQGELAAGKQAAETARQAADKLRQKDAREIAALNQMLAEERAKPAPQTRSPMAPAPEVNIGGGIGKMTGGSANHLYAFGNQYYGTTSAQVLKGQLRIPTFATPKDKQKFLAALDEISKLANGDLSGIMMPLIDAVGNDPLVDINHLDLALKSLDELLTKAVSISTQLQAIFQRYPPAYRADLEQVLPEQPGKVMSDFIVVLRGFRQSVETIAQVKEKHPDDRELLDGMVTNLESQAEMVRNTIPGRIIAVANERIPYFKKELTAKD